MRILVQRVREAAVRIDGNQISRIGTGLLVLVGIRSEDTERDVAWLSDKLVHLRIFEDSSGKMAHDVMTVGGSLLIVSQFTLYGAVQKGRRPDFAAAAPGDVARPLYERFVAACRAQWDHVEVGVFGEDMDIHLVNWGPVTLWLESPPSTSVKNGKENA